MRKKDLHLGKKLVIFLKVLPMHPLMKMMMMKSKRRQVISLLSLLNFLVILLGQVLNHQVFTPGMIFVMPVLSLYQILLMVLGL